MKIMTDSELTATHGAGDPIDPLTMPPDWSPDPGPDFQAILDALAAQAQADQEKAWLEFMATQEQ